MAHGLDTGGCVAQDVVRTCFRHEPGGHVDAGAWKGVRTTSEGLLERGVIRSLQNETRSIENQSRIFPLHI